MQEGIPAEREKNLLQTLLMQQGITKYQVFEPSQEGTSLLGSTYPFEIESPSGLVITPTKVYTSWLDWIDGHYTLREEEGFWKELRIEELRHDRDRVTQIQQQLREKEEGQVLSTVNQYIELDIVPQM